MNIIIPMAGMGKRMRPHTLTTPKPLLKIGGKTIIEWLIEELIDIIDTKIDEVNFVIGNFDNKKKEFLKNIAKKYKSKANFFIQEEALGTAHAVYCAEEKLKGQIIIAFADTIFNCKKRLNKKEEGIIFTKKVENPEQYGVIRIDNNGYINEMFEKPNEFISNDAIIGIYYFKEGNILRESIKNLIENKRMINNEYQLTCSLVELMKTKIRFKNLEINDWLDCGNKEEFLKTNKKLFDLGKINDKEIRSVKKKNSIIIEPCYIEENVEMNNCIIGPYATISKNCILNNVIAKESIIYENTKINNIIIENSIIGKNCKIAGDKKNINSGDFSEV